MDMQGITTNVSRKDKLTEADNMEMIDMKSIEAAADNAEERAHMGLEQADNATTSVEGVAGTTEKSVSAKKSEPTPVANIQAESKGATKTDSVHILSDAPVERDEDCNTEEQPKNTNAKSTKKKSGARTKKKTSQPDVGAAASDEENKDNKRKTLAQKKKRKIAMEEMKKKKDHELIAIADEATQNHVTSPDDFREYFGVDYEYRDVTEELKARGYKKVWARVDGDKPSENVADNNVTEYSVQKPDKSAIVRPPISVNKEVYTKWKNTMENFKYPSTCVDIAFTRFIDDLKTGRIVFKIGG